METEGGATELVGECTGHVRRRWINAINTRSSEHISRRSLCFNNLQFLLFRDLMHSFVKLNRNSLSVLRSIEYLGHLAHKRPILIQKRSLVASRVIMLAPDRAAEVFDHQAAVQIRLLLEN